MIEDDKKPKKRKIKIKEVVFKKEEKVKISDDCYNLTIAANMTKNCRPEALIFCLRQCIFVFCIQLGIAHCKCSRAVSSLPRTDNMVQWLG